MTGALLISAKNALLFAVFFSLLLFGLDRAFFGLDLTRSDLGYLCQLGQGLSDISQLFISSFGGSGGLKMGEPVWANPTIPLFHLPYWIAAIIGQFSRPEWGLNGIILFQMGMAASGVFHLFKTFHSPEPTRTPAETHALAVMAGAAYVMCGTFLDLMRHGHSFLAGGAWIPWAWWAMRTKSPVSLFISTFMILSATEPQAYLMCGFLFVIEWLFNRELKTAIRLGPAFAIPIVLTSVQWYAALKVAPRHEGFPLDSQLAWSMDLPALIASVIPGAFQDSTLGLWKHFQGEVQAGLWNQSSQPWNESPFLGLSLFTLSLLGFFLATKRNHSILRPAMVVALFFSLLSLGPKTPVFSYLYKVFLPMQVFRYPEKYLVGALPAMVVLGFAGLSQIAHKPKLLAITCTATAGSLIALFHFIGLDLERDHYLMFLGPSLLLLILVYYRHRSGKLTLTFLGIPILLELGIALPHSINLAPPLSKWESIIPNDLKGLVCLDRNLEGLAWVSTDQNTPRPIDPFITLQKFSVPNLNVCQKREIANRYSQMSPLIYVALEQALFEGDLEAARFLGCHHMIYPDKPIRIVPIKDPLPEGGWILDPKWVEPFKDRTFADYSSDNIVPRDLLSQIEGPAPITALSNMRVSPSELTFSKQSNVNLTAKWRADNLQGHAVLWLRVPYYTGWKVVQNGKYFQPLRVGHYWLGAWVDLSLGSAEFRYKPIF